MQNKKNKKQKTSEETSSSNCRHILKTDVC